MFWREEKKIRFFQTEKVKLRDRNERESPKNTHFHCLANGEIKKKTILL